MPHILIVEDEEKLARFLELELTHEGYTVEKCANGLDAVTSVTRTLAGEGTPFDLILLDVMLPGINGMEVLRRIRLLRKDPADGGLNGALDMSGQQTYPEDCPHIPPVIMLTARDQVMDKVAGLDAGAADYVTKPFAIEELLARIRVALKLHPVAGTTGVSGAAGADENGTGGQTGENGPDGYRDANGAGGSPFPAGRGTEQGRLSGTDRAKQSDQEGVLRWKSLTLDIPRHRVTWEQETVTLTNREFEMLRTLLENRDIVLSRDVLLSKVCGYDYVGETNVIDVYVRYLRSKIDEAYQVKMIRTVRGVGYVIDSDE